MDRVKTPSKFWTTTVMTARNMGTMRSIASRAETTPTILLFEISDFECRKGVMLRFLLLLLSSSNYLLSLYTRLIVFFHIRLTRLDS